MRMWMVPVVGLCDNHLLGEHVEHHMFVGSLQKKIAMDGYIKNNLMEPEALNRRHDELAEEMLKRGMNHKSPLAPADISYLSDAQQKAVVDVQSSLEDLVTRCPACLKRMRVIGVYPS